MVSATVLTRVLPEVLSWEGGVTRIFVAHPMTLCGDVGEVLMVYQTCKQSY